MTDDLISRQAAIDAFAMGEELLKCALGQMYVVGNKREKYEFGLGLIKSYIADIKGLPSAQPTADVRENIKAHWVAISDARHPYRCSNCGSEFDVETMMLRPIWNFCPYCGAQMNEEELEITEEDWHRDEWREDEWDERRDDEN